MREEASHFFRTVLTVGRSRQSFIGASWIPKVLRSCPKKYRRKLTLYILSLSPHYFFKDKDKNYRNVRFSDFLELEYRRNDQSRAKFFKLIRPYIRKNDVVIDFGCGPGFLSKHLAHASKNVFAADISSGVLECAKIISSSEKISYLLVKNLNKAVADKSVDAVFTLAVIQHVTDAVFGEILKMSFDKLKSGGLIVFHVPIEAKGWKSEKQCRHDRSIYGRLKWKYGLNCFSRTEKEIRKLLKKYHFKEIEISNIKDLCRDHFDDVCDQQIVIARKP